MTMETVTGAATAGAQRAGEFFRNGAAKAEELGKEGYNTAKEYAKKGFKSLKDFGVKAGEKLKPLADDTVALGKDAVKYAKANPGKTALIVAGALTLVAGVTAFIHTITHKTPEKTTEKA